MELNCVVFVPTIAQNVMSVSCLLGDGQIVFVHEDRRRLEDEEHSCWRW